MQIVAINIIVDIIVIIITINIVIDIITIITIEYIINNNNLRKTESDCTLIAIPRRKKTKPSQLKGGNSFGDSMLTIAWEYEYDYKNLL